ncbi:MAG TPA: hypothetical protein VI197_31655 [Polyangiaceae bacterium]
MEEQRERTVDPGHELTDDELECVVGGGLLSSPLGTRAYARGIQGSGAPQLADVLAE